MRINNKNNLTIHKSFEYNVTLGLRIFNYNQIANFLSTNDNHLCFCNNPCYSNYVNLDYDHIITGKVNIVENVYLLNKRQMELNFVFSVVLILIQF